MAQAEPETRVWKTFHLLRERVCNLLYFLLSMAVLLSLSPSVRNGISQFLLHCITHSSADILIFMVNLASALLFLNGIRRILALLLLLSLINSYWRFLTGQYTWTKWLHDKDQIISITFLIQMVALSLVYILIWIVSHATKTLVTKCFFITGVLVAIILSVSIWFELWCLGSQIRIPWDGSRNVILHSGNHFRHDVIRAAGLALNPNHAALMILAAWPSLLYFRSNHLAHNLALASLAVFLVLSACLTYSRAGYIGIILQFAVLLFVLYHSKKKLALRYVIVVCILLATSVVLIVPHFFERLTSVTDVSDRSIQNRTRVLTVAIELFMTNSMLGLGPGYFHTIYNRLYKIPDETASFYNCHSTIVNSLLEIGTVGCLLLLGVFLYGITRCPKRLLLPSIITAVGSVVHLISENIGIWIPAILFASAHASLITGTDNKMYNSQEIRRWTCPVLAFLLYISLSFKPANRNSLALESLFEETIKNELNVAGDDIYFYYRDLSTNYELGVKENVSITSAQIAVLALALNRPSSACDDIDSTDYLFQALKCPDPTTVRQLLQTADITKLQDTMQTAIGVPVALQLNKNETSRSKFQTAMSQIELSSLTQFPILVNLTAKQYCALLYSIVGSDTKSQVARALLQNCNTWGFSRFLPEKPLFHLSGATHSLKCEVGYMDNGREQWVLFMQRINRIPRIGIEQASYKQMAKIAWIVHLYSRTPNLS